MVMVLAVVLVLTLGAVPTSAEPNVVYETNIVPGPWPADEVDPLDKGEVKVYTNGDFTIEIEGATPNRTYKVYVGEWVGGSTVSWSSPGWLTTDDEGEGTYSGTLTYGMHRPLFALNYPPYADTYGHANVFVSGFDIPQP